MDHANANGKRKASELPQSYGHLPHRGNASRSDQKGKRQRIDYSEHSEGFTKDQFVRKARHNTHGGARGVDKEDDVQEAAFLPEKLPELPPIDEKIAARVFTHQSALPAHQSSSELESYERYEFYGDAVLELAATKLLWKKCPTMRAGELSQNRERLIKNQTIGRYSLRYNFMDKLRISDAQKGTMKAQWKMAGDVFEAYVAAVVLSDERNGQAKAEKWLWKLWEPLTRHLQEDNPPQNLLLKEKLATKIMCKGTRLEYIEDKPPKKLPMGRAESYVRVELTGYGYEKEVIGYGVGLNKVQAGNNAAENVLQSDILPNLIANKAAEVERQAAEKAAAQEDVKMDAIATIMG